MNDPKIIEVLDSAIQEANVEGWDYVDLLFEDAQEILEALKMDRPRIMTEGDVLHSIGKPMWFESRGMYFGKKGFWVLLFEVDLELRIRFVQSVTGGKITFSLIDYGKMWRMWNKCPSPKQMQDTSWEVEDARSSENNTPS